MKTIRDRIPLPPGAVPARAQTWLLLAVTGTLAIALLAFPGQADKPPTSRTGVADGPAAPGSAPVSVGTVEQAAERLRADAAREAERRLRAQLGAPPPRPDGLPLFQPERRIERAPGPNVDRCLVSAKAGRARIDAARHSAISAHRRRRAFHSESTRNLPRHRVNRLSANAGRPG